MPGPKTEKVILARVYTQNGNMGIEFSKEGCREKTCYFLESFLKVERKEYDANFRSVKDTVEWGFED